MQRPKYLEFSHLKWFLVFAVLSACVDQIYLEIPKEARQLVVEGLITDQPGPYIVRLSLAFPSSVPDFLRDPEKNAVINLYEDGVMLEKLTEGVSGSYSTSSNVIGKVGHTYNITIQTSDGKKYSSAPDSMLVVGQLENVSYEFEKRSIVTQTGNASGDRFNIFVDAQPAPGPNSFTRWRVTGTYQFKSFPELIIAGGLGASSPAPLPCSGYVWDGFNLIRVAPCTCCICWATDYEDIQHVASTILINEQGYRHLKVGDVAITPRTFYDKYYVFLEQMSLTQTSYEFFRLIIVQSEGGGNIFQPPFGQIQGNVSGVDSNDKALGLFWASSVKSQGLFIQKSDIPYTVAPIDTIRNDCSALVNSVLQQPPFWR